MCQVRCLLGCIMHSIHRSIWCAPLMRARGYTLLEVLLVLAIGAAMMAVGLKAYRHIQQKSDVMQIRMDVQELQMALLKYYRFRGCLDGQFPDLHPRISQLSEHDQLPHKREPLIDAYEVSVVPMQDRTLHRKQRYQLRVDAVLNAKAPLSINVYQKLLGAGRIAARHLVWQMLPLARSVTKTDALWVANQQRRAFSLVYGSGQDHSCAG